MMQEVIDDENVNDRIKIFEKFADMEIPCRDLKTADVMENVVKARHELGEE